MIEHVDSIVYLSLIVPLTLASYVIGGLIYTFYMDYKNPPKPMQYVWRTVWPDYKGEWERGSATEVYCEQYTNDIRGKVVRQNDGLYVATMWNGDYKEFLMNYEATKWVEQYKARVYK